MAYPIVLVDDHDLVRGGLQALIEADDTFKISAQFSNGMELLKSLSGLTPQPAVIILDLDMPVMNGQQTLKEIQAISDAYHVLILTISGDDATVLDMVRMGARGFLPKYCTRQELRQALYDIIRNGYYHSELEVKVLHQSVRANSPVPATNLRLMEPHLTRRELEFIRYVCDREELSYKLIADRMNVAVRTVDGYREAVFFKLNIKTKLGLVFYALRQGLVSLKDL